MDLPYDGAISRYFEAEAPDDVRQLIAGARKGDILNPDFPYTDKMGRKKFNKDMDKLQIELARLQAWVKESGQRVAIVFEGRDAAGKGGTINWFQTNLNPRGARVVALSKPTETEAAQWYFQRYIAHLPARGEMVFFDRSWYNRGVVEHVFGFCTSAQREAWFRQVPEFEHMLVEEGILLFKIWLNVGRATQLKRFLDREKDLLKQWKLSRIDVDGLSKWDEYSAAIEETLTRTNNATAPWTIIRADDKKRARLNTIRAVLGKLPYTLRDAKALGVVDPLIAGGPDLWHG
jgi:polyphosphate kinase 2